MAETTGIGWTEATWNPWYGCKKVSPGCDRCYMFRQQRRYGRDPEVVTRSKTTFADPLKWKEPTLCFTCSWSDWFHEAADGWRDEAWDIIRRTPQHTYQILTKRPARIMRHLPPDWGDGYPNVWLGVSVEDHFWAERRLKVLLSIPAVVRFASAEPLLGPVDFTHLNVGDWHSLNALTGDHTVGSMAPRVTKGPRLDWLIVGGESGEPNDLPRPMEVEWARTARDQCQAHGVAFFLKQLGGYPDAMAHDKAVLDGRTWTEYPASRRLVSERRAPSGEKA